MSETRELNVLSIDAWRESEGGWTWNSWHKVGTIDLEEFENLDTNRKILKWFRDAGFTCYASAGLCAVEDDQYNIVVTERNGGRPLFAIEYGPAYN